MENEVKRLAASVREKSITVDHLDVSIRLGVSSRNLPTTDEPALALPTAQSLPGAIEALERRMIADALRESSGNKRKAAQALGLSRQGVDQEVEAALYSSMSYHRLAGQRQ